MSAFQDLINQKFGRLTVLSLNPVRTKRGHCKWDCVCECGGLTTVWATQLKSGGSKSCGCLRKTHGKSSNSTYSIWHAMKTRCTNKNNTYYHRYGGRGIKVCSRWVDFNNFFEDMGSRPDGMCIDRINNDGDYEPSNCRWVTPTENSRNTMKSKWWFVDGVRYASLSAAARSIGVSHSCIERRCNSINYPNYSCELKY